MTTRPHDLPETAEDADAPAERRRALRWLPLVPAAVTLGVTLTGIRGPSFWLDEAATVSMTTRPAGDMVRVFDHLDLVHALYYLMMRPWVLVFGPGELAMRAPSALAMAAAAGGVAVIGRRCLGAVPGLLGGLAFAVSVPVTRFAQEARSYAMVTAVAVLATYLLVRAAGDDERRPWRWFAGYAPVVVLLGLLHLNAVLLLAAHGVTLLTARARAGLLARWLVSAGLAAAPLTMFALAAQDQKFQVEWLPEPSWTTVRVLAEFVAGGRWAVLPLLALAAAGAAAGIRSRGTASLTAVALPWLVVPPALMLVMSVLADPVFMYRYTVFCVPGAALLAGAGLARLAALGRPAAGAAVLAAAAAALVVPTLPEHAHARRQDSRPDDTRAAADAVRARARPGDAVVYLAGAARWSASAYPDAFGGLDDVGARRSPVAAANLKGRDLLPRELGPRLAGAGRVWVMDHRALYPHEPVVDRREAAVRAAGPWRIAGTWTFRGGRLVLYERTGPYRTSK
ncbi:glycosyltransferase family 39 protein [Actinomadura monticuli]|uniref:Glycosyltransferase family 39 protein n=1 Tax=Actinomadura monticuli TaxID=3097367 RepID=A0ABV4Q5N3_9ACTN